MIKNILIIFLIYIISSLLIANPNNIEIFNRTFLKTKKLVETGYDHIENKLKGATFSFPEAMSLLGGFEIKIE